MNILGISAYYHDSAAALVRDGEIVAAAQEERFTRKKHDYAFPQNAIDYCLREAEIGRNELDLVVFYDKPLLKFERILETYVSYSPSGFTRRVATLATNLLGPTDQIGSRPRSFLTCRRNRQATSAGTPKRRVVPETSINR